MLATLASFFSDKIISPTQLTSQCRFIARFYWLKQQLNIDAQKLKENECRFFNLFYQSADPESLTVVFPAIHPNSASSAFGHTLLRIDKKGRRDETRMLDYSINYNATVDKNDNPFFYVLKGLVGRYKGRFSVLPYHMKLREYAQMENRDIWEYTLNLSESDTRFVIMHAYELVPTYFDYYYYDENCSYHLLSLLDIINQKRSFLDEIKPWTVPIDTIKILEKRGLIKKTYYRSSQSQNIQEKRKQLDGPQQNLALKLAQAPEKHLPELSTLNTSTQINILDLAFDYARYQKIQQSETVAVSLSKIERQLLKARSKIKQASPKLTIKKPGIQPDQGHDTSRTAIRAGMLNDKPYTELGWRLTYHGPTDIKAGYATDAEIEFFDISFRQYDQKESPQLARIKLLNINSLTAVDKFFFKNSWHINMDYQRFFDQTDKLTGRSILEGGPGYGFKPFKNKAFIIAAYIDFKSEYSKSYSQKYRLSIGPSININFSPLHRWRINMMIKQDWSVKGDVNDQYSIELAQGIQLSRSIATTISYLKNNVYKNDNEQFSVSINYYY